MYETSEYMKLWQFAKTFNYGNILEELKEYFQYLHDKDEIDEIGLKLQVCVKKSKPMYLHGYVLTSALNQYLENSEEKNITILETGTARGFSSVLMASILNKFNVDGKIHTIDKVNKFDNCLKSSELKKEITINECVEEWNEITDKYINFIVGDSKKILKNLNSKLDRINFAFLDGAHFYQDIKSEMEFTEKKQVKGDVIVCDDYTKTQFPEICKAVDEFLSSGKYEYKIFYGDDGTKKRGYVYMKKL